MEWSTSINTYGFVKNTANTHTQQTKDKVTPSALEFVVHEEVSEPVDVREKEQ